ncbi:MAG: ribonuclease Z, partial [Lactobacillus iners]|nr:ribonuclease Z [Lactobacillus iners]
RPGELQMDKLKQYNLPNGPILGRLKAGETVEYNGHVLNGKDFLGKPRLGRIVSIIYDTRPTNVIGQLAEDADVLIHESTFSGIDSKMAHRYYHSTCVDAATVALQHNVRRLFLTHISARYIGKNSRILEKEAQKIFSNTKLANDFDSYEIKARD